MLPFVAAVMATGLAVPAIIKPVRYISTASIATSASATSHQTFQLAGTPAIRVTVPAGAVCDDNGNFTAAQSTVVIRWTEGQIDCRQAVKLPAKWAPWTSNTPLSYEPTAVSWPGRPFPTIVVAAFRESGMYGVRAPIVMELHRCRWEVVNRRPEMQEFTNRGSFFIRGSRLYVWDYEADRQRAHATPQRYWLKTYRLRGDQLVLTRVRRTRRRYPSSDLESFADPKPIPIANDPLREFGLRFHWWGQSK